MEDSEINNQFATSLNKFSKTLRLLEDKLIL